MSLHDGSFRVWVQVLCWQSRGGNVGVLSCPPQKVPRVSTCVHGILADLVGFSEEMVLSSEAGPLAVRQQ